MNTRKYEVGSIIRHPRKPEWGPGRILAVQGSNVTVYFRDLTANNPEDATRTINVDLVALETSGIQSDPLLDNLPTYVNGKFERTSGTRVTLEQGIEEFREYFPLLFKDPAYIGDAHSGERYCKWSAHMRFEETLAHGRLQSLLKSNRIDEVRNFALAVEGHTNLLSIFEKAAFRDGLRDDTAVMNFFHALGQVLLEKDIDSSKFEDYFSAVESLPQKEGKTSPAKWTIATYLPYIAQPERFMFLKPAVTKDCAARLTFELNYRTQLNWLTYSKLLEMSEYLLEILRPYGAQDFIDVQSFIWVIGRNK